eukprot:15772-Eustigmatos_ZCMA.PRE.1
MVREDDQGLHLHYHENGPTEPVERRVVPSDCVYAHGVHRPTLLDEARRDAYIRTIHKHGDTTIWSLTPACI